MKLLTSLRPSDLESWFPPLPSGFEIESIWNRLTSLNPLGAYVVAIRLMYGFGSQPWFQQVELVDSGLAMVVQTPSYNVIIYTSKVRTTTELTTGLCVRALYDAVNKMATREPGFFESTNYIVKNGEPIGRILITIVDWPGVSNSLPNGTLNSTATVQNYPSSNLQARTKTRTTRTTKTTKSTSPSSTPTADSGEITDPDDRLFKIRYEFRGANIPVGDMFNAAMDGLARAAQIGYDTYCHDITALSISRKVVWYVGRSSEETLLGGELGRVFFLLVRDLFLVKRRFQETWFTLSYDGEDLADGYVIKWSPQAITASK
ncbi:hypothetical protein ACLMJK_001731 [Lecanora helva]